MNVEQAALVREFSRPQKLDAILLQMVLDDLVCINLVKDNWDEPVLLDWEKNL